MSRMPPRGFTLIEILVVLAVLGILLGVGVPSFVEVAKDSRTRAEYNRVARSLFLARSESAKRSRPVTLCARRSESSCGTDWNAGWLVFVDAPPVADGAVASIGAEDTLIGIEDAFAVNGGTLQVFGSANGLVDEARGLGHLSYRSNGSTTLMNASFLLCDGRGAERSRVANVVITGDVRPGRPNGRETIPRDVFGRPIDCPGP